MTKLAILALLLQVTFIHNAYTPTNPDDSNPMYKDTEAGAVRVTHIRERLKASTCPWISDGRIEGWWSGKQPGVVIRHWDLAVSGFGKAIANFYQRPNGNPVNDARFAAHACADIEYLLEHQAK